MSESTELLSTIVEFSIGLAGFSGVVGIFIHRSGKWIYVDRFRILNLLIMSLTPGFLSFVSLGLLQTTSNAIEISAAIFAATLAILMFFISRARSKVPAADKHLVGLQIFVPMLSTFIIVMVLQTLVAFSVIDSHEFIVYYYSLVAMLFLAVVQFARLILARPEFSSAPTVEDP
ncbi:MAG: hypothetical protein ACI9ON_002318 [Limisphaerales bacterium]|jgi:hypothetical protein